MEKLEAVKGSAIREARARMSLTQEQTAELVGISYEFYARIERGHALPSVPTLHRIAQVLEVSCDAVLGIDPDEPTTQMPSLPPLTTKDPPILRRIVARLSSSSRSELVLVTAFLVELEKQRQRQPEFEPDP